MQQRNSENQTRSPDWPAWGKAWGGLVVIAFVNGVLHRTYERRLGELRSHQVSSLLLLGLLAPWVIRTEHRHPLPTLPAALQVGLMWSSASVAFEFLFGHYINKDSWSELLHAAGAMMPRSISLTIQNGVGLDAYSVRLPGSVQAVSIGRRCCPNTKNAATSNSTTPAVRSTLIVGRGSGGTICQASTTTASARMKMASSRGK